MLRYETKVVTVAAGGMNSKLRKLARQGWRVTSSSPNGFAGAMTVTLERPITGPALPVVDPEAKTPGTHPGPPPRSRRRLLGRGVRRGAPPAPWPTEGD